MGGKLEFQELKKMLIGAEAFPSRLRISSLPAETVAMSDDDTLVAADSLLPGQRILILEDSDPTWPAAQLFGVVANHTSFSSVSGALTILILSRETGGWYACDVFPEHMSIYAFSGLCGRPVTCMGDVRAACIATERALTVLYCRRALTSVAQATRRVGGAARKEERGESGERGDKKNKEGKEDQKELPLTVVPHVLPPNVVPNVVSDDVYDVPIPVDPSLRTHREVAFMLYGTIRSKMTMRSSAADKYLTLLKLAAASENIFLRNAARHPLLVESPVTSMLRDRLKELITKQEDAGDHSLSKSLIDECIVNLNDSTTPGPGTKASTRDSLHPIFPRCTYTDTVFMEGAKMLWVLFDPRCETRRGATLSFYHGSDVRCQRPIAQFTGNNFMPFVVPGNKVHFRFTCSVSVSEGYDDGSHDAAEGSGGQGCGWGYRFQVRPLRGLSWKSERQIQSPSLEWACWLLEFLLNEVEELGRGTVHNKKVFNAMVAYLRAKGTPYKHRIIALLTQMLRSPEKFPRGEIPNTRALRGIESAVFDWCKEHQERTSKSSSSRGRSRSSRSTTTTILPRRVMQLIEMSITARVSASDFESIGRGQTPRTYGRVDPSSETPLVPVPTPILHVAGSDEGAILVDVVKSTEALYGRKRLPDELMNQAIMEAHGMEVTLSMRTHAVLTEELMETAIRNDAWWTSEADLQLVEYATKLAAKASMSPSKIEPSTLLLSKEEKKLRDAVNKAETQASVGKKKMNGAETLLHGIKKMFGGSGSKQQKTKKLDKEIVEELSPYPLLLSEYHRQQGNGMTFRTRFSIIRKFNLQLQVVVRMIDLLDTSASWSLGTFFVLCLCLCLFLLLLPTSHLFSSPHLLPTFPFPFPIICRIQSQPFDGKNLFRF